MTCKDCIYYDKCVSRISYMMDIDVVTNELINDMDERCRDFKDKSKYIELPCKVGDIVYIIEPFNGICDMTLRNVHVNDLLKNNIFLTKSEAEQKLKELKENA